MHCKHLDAVLGWNIEKKNLSYASDLYVVQFKKRINTLSLSLAHTALPKHPPALEVCHHVPPLGNLGGAVQTHVGVFPVDHVLLWEVQGMRWVVGRRKREEVKNKNQPLSRRRADGLTFTQQQVLKKASVQCGDFFFLDLRFSAC